MSLACAPFESYAEMRVHGRRLRVLLPNNMVWIELFNACTNGFYSRRMNGHRQAVTCAFMRALIAVRSSR